MCTDRVATRRGVPRPGGRRTGTCNLPLGSPLLRGRTGPLSTLHPATAPGCAFMPGTDRSHFPDPVRCPAPAAPPSSRGRRAASAPRRRRRLAAEGFDVVVGARRARPPGVAGRVDRGARAAAGRDRRRVGGGVRRCAGPGGRAGQQRRRGVRRRSGGRGRPGLVGALLRRERARVGAADQGPAARTARVGRRGRAVRELDRRADLLRGRAPRTPRPSTGCTRWPRRCGSSSTASRCA